jgi:hypothetical protein
MRGCAAIGFFKPCLAMRFAIMGVPPDIELDTLDRRLSGFRIAAVDLAQPSRWDRQ